MKIGQFLQLIKKEEWYKQGGGIKPLYIGYPWRTCYTKFTINHKPVPLSYRNMVGYMRDHFFDVYFPKSTMRRIARFYAARGAHDSRWAERLLANWVKEDAIPLRKYMNAWQLRDLSGLSNAELRREFLHFSKQYDRLWREAIFLDSFDCVGDELLYESASETGVKLTDNELHLLTTSTKISWLQRERLELLKLTKEASRSKALKSLVMKAASNAIREQFPSFYRKLLYHQNTYHWIYNDYAVIRFLDVDFFTGRIAHLLKTPKELSGEIKELGNLDAILRKQKELIARRRMPKRFVNTVRFLLTLARWRDERKSHNQMANALLFKFASEASKRTGIGRDNLEMLFWPEFSLVLGGNRKPIMRVHHRLQGIFFTGDQQNQANSISGKRGKSVWLALEQELTKNSKLEGRPAYPGIVKGTVRIVRHQGDFHKMKKGDILIAPNTRPEYVPIMKIAGAIITEEGGITSHAAIVSRELKKPCIVGAQGIIQQLKDGDIIEVDANKGTVKKLK